MAGRDAGLQADGTGAVTSNIGHRKTVVSSQESLISDQWSGEKEGFHLNP
jgi:hypothetical protein